MYKRKEKKKTGIVGCERFPKNRSGGSISAEVALREKRTEKERECSLLNQVSCTHEGIVVYMFFFFFFLEPETVTRLL